MTASRILCAVVLLSLACWAQTDDEAKQKLDEFRQTYKTNDELARVDAVRTLAQVYASSVTKVLVSVLNADPSVQVRKAAAEALGRPADDLAIQALGAAIEANKKAPDVLTEIAKALAACDSEKGLPALHGLFGHYKDGVAMEAVYATGKIASPGSIQPLLILLRKAEQERDAVPDINASESDPSPSEDTDLVNLVEPCLSALGSCTGAEAKTYKEWDSWWKKAQGSLQSSQVFWCPGTRQTFEVQPGEKKHCPHDGDEVKDCGVLLKHKIFTKE